MIEQITIMNRIEDIKDITSITQGKKTYKIIPIKL